MPTPVADRADLQDEIENALANTQNHGSYVESTVGAVSYALAKILWEAGWRK